MNKLTNKQVKHLKGLAHHLSPVLTVGKGSLSEALLKEAEVTLEHHQLIKVKILCEDRDEFRELCEDLAFATEATLLQTLGRIAIFYRSPRNPETKVKIKIA